MAADDERRETARRWHGSEVTTGGRGRAGDQRDDGGRARGDQTVGSPRRRRHQRGARVVGGRPGPPGATTVVDVGLGGRSAADRKTATCSPRWSNRGRQSLHRVRRWPSAGRHVTAARASTSTVDDSVVTLVAGDVDEKKVVSHGAGTAGDVVVVGDGTVVVVDGSGWWSVEDVVVVVVVVVVVPSSGGAGGGGHEAARRGTAGGSARGGAMRRGACRGRSATR